MSRNSLNNQDGIGLIAAIFIIVVVAMFGILIARYTMISSQSSAEDLLWSQALFSAESAAQLRILHDDAGGPVGWAAWNDPTINNFSTTVTNPPTAVTVSIKRITSRASRAGIIRTIDVHYDLTL